MNDDNYNTTNNTMNPLTCTYNMPLDKEQMEYHNKFKGAHGNLTKGLPEYKKKMVKQVLNGLEVCHCPVESITLVNKYVDAMEDVNNRELIRDAWKEIYSLAKTCYPSPPRVFGEHGPNRLS